MTSEMTQGASAVDRQQQLKRRARDLVGKALKAGTLVRTPCDICGNLKVEAHHDDYSKPRSVRWLCRKHHSSIHTTSDMMNRATKINQLHRHVYDGWRTTLRDAIEIGELLTAQKAECNHGAWIAWIGANLNFDRTMAARYMRCFRNRARLDVLNVDSGAHLTIAEFARVAPKSAKEEKINGRHKPIDNTAAVLADRLKAFWARYGNGLIELETIPALFEEVAAIVGMDTISTIMEVWNDVREEVADDYPV